MSGSTNKFGLAVVLSAAVLVAGCAGTGPNQAVGTGVRSEEHTS